MNRPNRRLPQPSPSPSPSSNLSLSLSLSKKLSLLLILPALLTLSACNNQTPPNSSERELLLNDKDFARFGISKGGRYAKSVQYLTRTTELSFTHTRAKNFYLYSAASLYPNAGDALINSYASNFGASYSLENNGLQKQPLSLSASYEKGSSLDLLTKDGEPVGNLFFTRTGKKGVFILFTGVYFEQAADFEAFIEPRLQRLRDYESRDPLVGWVGDLFASDSEKPAQPKNQ